MAVTQTAVTYSEDYLFKIKCLHYKTFKVLCKGSGNKRSAQILKALVDASVPGIANLMLWVEEKLLLSFSIKLLICVCWGENVIFYLTVTSIVLLFLNCMEWPFFFFLLVF